MGLRYALVNAAGDIKIIREDVDPAVQTKAGWRWIPVEQVGRDAAFDAETEIKSGPVVTVEASRVVETWSVRAKTAAELDRQKDAAAQGFGRIEGLVAFNHENRLRALEGKAALTPVQFRAALKAML